jgi:hypothetical protein
MGASVSPRSSLEMVVAISERDTTMEFNVLCFCISKTDSPCILSNKVQASLHSDKDLIQTFIEQGNVERNRTLFI